MYFSQFPYITYDSSGNEDIKIVTNLLKRVGLRAKTPEELDDKIIEMLNTDRPVIFDCRVDKQENCFPMIPSGKPHNQMLLGPKDQKGKKITGKGKTLV